MENAKIYAENVIRNRKEALNLKRFSVKMGALSSKLESAYRTQQVSIWSDSYKRYQKPSATVFLSSKTA